MAEGQKGGLARLGLEGLEGLETEEKEHCQFKVIKNFIESRVGGGFIKRKGKTMTVGLYEELNDGPNRACLAGNEEINIVPKKEREWFFISLFRGPLKKRKN